MVYVTMNTPLSPIFVTNRLWLAKKLRRFSPAVLSRFACRKSLLWYALIAILASPQVSNAGYSAHVVEANTGSILYSHKPNAHNFPASLGKVMTLYLVFRGLDRGDFSLETKIPISKYAARQPASKLGLPAGDSISIQDSILALTTKSANDIASALAEFLTGTEREFAKTMTQQARLLGMKNTTFRNASGLPHSQQKTTALDMTILGRALYIDFAHYCDFFAQRKFTFRGTTYRNHNSLLGVYRGVNGIKTGYIRASGYHLMVSGLHNHHHVIAVVLGGRTARSRDQQMRRLLDRAYYALDRKDELLSSIVVPPEKPNKTTQHNRQMKPQEKIASARTSSNEANQEGPLSKEAENQSKGTGAWAVQLGAFSNPHAANLLLERIIKLYPDELISTSPHVLPITTEVGTLFRAKHIGLTEESARRLCSKLKKQAQPCIVVGP
jgi:D-alanyl-D-alanine carboxypeptidase